MKRRNRGNHGSCSRRRGSAQALRSPAFHKEPCSVLRLRAEADARMFSTSVLVVYDDAHPERVECRLLDFAKTYFDIKKRAAECHESVEDCEDGVIPALSNLKWMIRSCFYRLSGSRSKRSATTRSNSSGSSNIAKSYAHFRTQGYARPHMQGSPMFLSSASDRFNCQLAF